MRSAASLTPMFRQYRALKNNHPDSILLFRMGDFYEMFFEDAKVASGLLELTLTSRGKGTANVVPMCGFPHHQLESYTAKLVRSERRVAICDQVEDPRQAKGLVRREVVRVVTPGTVTDPEQLESKANAWLAAVSHLGRQLGAAFLDLSTGEFLAWESVSGAEAWPALADRLAAFTPREIVHGEDFPWPARRPLPRATRTPVDASAFSVEGARSLLLRQFAVASLDGFGLRQRDAAIAAAGGLLQYVQDTQKCGLEHINELLYHEPTEFVLLDPATLRNLEIERATRGTRHGSLFHALDTTVTPGGGRRLRRWLLAPLLDVSRIRERQDAVEAFVNAAAQREHVRERLEGVRDVERLLARTVAGTAGPRDLYALRLSLERVPGLLRELDGLPAAWLQRHLEGFDPCEDVAALLARALAEDPPATLRDGGVIAEGHDAELDELRAARRDGRGFIASLEARERQATGIASLKVRFNKVFGYFIEVSKPNLHLVPERYARKQTIASGERFETPELKEHERKVLHAQERIEARELELFVGLRGRVAAEAGRLKRLARLTAGVDVLAALAEVAVRQDYRRPEVDVSGELQIAGGRHPVVEQALLDARFVPNGTELSAGGRTIAVLTGPNMGGKSTYLRQVALIALLAQCGSFVPAQSARLGVVDRIFCRVGASDQLSEGQSTFMVEMSETANILHHATSRSLILLDEIGRGTATFDGLSIAWAVVEYLARVAGGAPRTLFATHYHELTELSVELPSVINLRMGVREHGEEVVFLHRVEAGAADRSYGIQVARLAGVPRPVVDRAREILANLERDEYGRDGLPRRARGRGAPPGQGSLFDTPAPAPREEPASRVLAELRELDTDQLTPLDALEILARWRERLR